MSKPKIYIVSILIPLIVGGLVGWVTAGEMEAFEALNKPPLSPPGILFPIVWSILYILMGVSYAILKTNGLVDSKVNLIYYIQLGVNALWSIIFFNLKWRLFAFFWLLLLIGLVIAMIVVFYRKKKIAGLLQIPYLVWCTFAAYLNMAIYLLNG